MALKKVESKVSSLCFFKVHVEVILLHKINFFLSVKILRHKKYAYFKFLYDIKLSPQIYLKEDTVLNTKFEEKSCINGFIYIDTNTQDFHGVGKAVDSGLVGV